MISKCSAGDSQGENIELHLVALQTSKARENETSNKILAAIANKVAIFQRFFKKEKKMSAEFQNSEMYMKNF